MAGFGFMWFWLVYRVTAEYVLLDQADVLSGSVVPFGLALHIVAFRGGSFVKYGTGDIC